MKPLTENELIALIRSSRPEDKATLDEFLNTAPPMVANDLLHGLARNIPLKYVSRKVTWVIILVVSFVGLCLCSSIFWLVQDLRAGKPLWHSLRTSPCANGLPFVCFLVISRERAKLYRGSEEALFLLSARNDSRALPVLMRQWLHNPTELQRDWNDRVEAEATRLLDENRTGTSSAEWKTIRSIITQITHSKEKRTVREREDITPGQAYLAAAIIRVLARAGGVENGEVLKTVSELPADAERFPNRAFVIEVAQVCYGAEDTDPLTVTNHLSHSHAVNSLRSTAQSADTSRELMTVSARKGNS